MLTLLNTSILTNYGSYQYEPLEDAESARAVVRNCEDGIQSAIGHQSTADILSTLLEISVQVNRIEFRQPVGYEGRALIFKLKGRPPEGVILTAEELQAIGYEFGLLTRTA